MTRTHFEKSLSELHVMVAEMAAMAERSFDKAMLALKKEDPLLAREVILGDERVDEMEAKIERACVSLIALQQPIADDLRLVTAVLKMITDIERIADQASDISELMLPDLALMKVKIPSRVFEMGEYAKRMVHDAVHAYLQQDELLALAVIERDDQMDVWFEELTGHFKALLEAHADPAQVLKLAFVAKYLERVADHATNVAEWALYRIRGER